MTGSYAETCVKKKATITTFMAKAGLILLVLVAFTFSVMLGTGTTVGYIAMMLSSLMLVGLFFVLPRFNIEYEYIFCDGQIDFDLILGGNKRKRGMRIDFENVEIMAPENSHSLDSYGRQQQIKVKDYTSRESGTKRYVIYVRKGDQLTKIIFEPDDKMVQCAKQKSPRKVIEY